MKLSSIILMFISLNIYAQEESFPCTKANPGLVELFSTGSLDELYVHYCYGPGLDELATSFLKPSGTAPKIFEDPDGMEPPEDTDYVNWTCMYSAGQIGDSNPATAWVEGVKGYGIGECIFVPCLDLKKPVEIWSGYGKSEKLHQFNSRPSKIKLIIVRAKQGNPSQYGTSYSNLQVVAENIIPLEDINGYQQINLPDFTVEHYHENFSDSENAYLYFLGIEIVDVYKGSKWDDTCISEVRNIN